MADIFEIAGRIHSTSQEHVTSPADEILDTSQNKKQHLINADVARHESEINSPTNGLNKRVADIEALGQIGDTPVETNASNIINNTSLNGKVPSASAVNGVYNAVVANAGYYTCDSEDSTDAKVVEASGYVLTVGGCIKIKMTNANTADDATLNINSTGAKALYYAGERASATNSWEEGETVEVYYDGTNFYANNVAGGSGSGDGAFDVSAKYPTSGVEGGNTYTLEGALAVLNANLSVRRKKGGMSIKFIDSSNNKYVQYRLIADEWTIDTNYWAISDEGVYVDNPEFVYVKTDKDDKILWAIKTDGSIYYGVGVPQQVVDYINERIEELSLDEYEDIVAFLNDLEKGDKTLQTLLNEKVDKEEGKSLIDSEYADGVHYVDNPEFVYVKTDSEDKILFGIKVDGEPYFGVGCPEQVKEYVEQKIAELSLDEYEDIVTFLSDYLGGDATLKSIIDNLTNTKVDKVAGKSLIDAEYADGVSQIENPEFAEVHTDVDDKVLYGVKQDGDFYFGAGIPSQVQEKLDNKAEVTEVAEIAANKVDKEEGKSLIDAGYASTKSTIDNPEFLEVTTDSEDKVLEGIQQDGTKVIGGDLNVGGSTSIDEDIKVLGNMEVSGVSYKVIENPEYIAAWVDAEDKIIFGFKVDGKTYVGDANFLDDIESIKVFLANFSDKNIDWDALTSITDTENPEFIEAKTDSEGKLLAGRTTDGAAFEKVGFSTPKISVNGTVTKNIEDPESRIEITTDSEDKVVSYRKSDGTLVEPKLSIPQSLSLGEKPTETIMGIGKQASEAKRYDKLAVYNLPKYGTVDIVQETFYLTSDSRVSSYNDVYVILDYEDNDANAAAKITIGYWYIKSTLTNNGDGTYSKNAGSVKLDFYAATKVTNVSGTYYVTSSLTKVVDPETGDVSYEVNEDSIEVTQIVGTPDVRTWPVDKKTEHYCVVNIDFGHYLSGSFNVGVKFQGSSTLEYRERNFRFTFYKNSSFAKKDKIKIGELIRQSGFNLKANWTDQTKLKELILNRLIISIWNTRDTDSRYPWNKKHPYSGATGTIKGFPVKVSIGGSFYGIDIFGLKKDEKNYLLEKAELDDETIIEGTGMFVSGTGGLFSGGAFQDSWSVNPEYWEDEMNDDDVLTTNNHTPADNTALTNFLTFVNGDSFDQEHAGERLDIVGWMDYFILMQVFVMYDNTSRNLIMYSDSERVKMYPFFYDLDLAWRIVDTARVHIDSDILANGVSYCEDMTMWDKLWSVYKDEIINRYCELRKTVLNADFVNTIYKSIVVSIPDEDIAQQEAKWGKTVTTKDMTPYIKWLTDRLSWLDINYFKI